jgi:hypothetical protein
MTDDENEVTIWPCQVLLTFDPSCKEDIKTALRVIRDYAKSDEHGCLVLVAK